MAPPHAIKTSAWSKPLPPTVRTSNQTTLAGTSIKVYHRTSRKSGLRSNAYSLNVSLRMVGHLCSRLQNQFNRQENRYIPGLAIEKSDIWIERVENGHDLLADQSRRLGDRDSLTPGATYVALELFQRLPRKIYRTAALNQMYPAVFANPDFARNCTAIFPLYLAGYRKHKGEHKLPVIELTADQQKALCHGLSVYADSDCGDLNNYTKSFDGKSPFDPNVEFEKGGYSMDASAFDAMMRQNGATPLREEAGMVYNTFSHDINVGDIVEDGRRKKRSHYFCYTLEPHFDFSRYNLAAVFDASSPGHVSLVRLSTGSQYPLPHELVVHDVRAAPKPSDDMLRSAYEKMMETDQPHQVCVFPTVNGFSIAPLVPQFCLDSLKMKAAAEPTRLDHWDDEDQQKVYRALILLFHASFDGAVYGAISLLEEAGFDCKGVEPWVLLFVLSELEDVLVDDLDDGTTIAVMDALNDKTADLLEVSIAGANVLKKSLTDVAESSPGGESHTSGETAPTIA